MTLIISLFILFIILNILDCITTTRALQKGCIERNKYISFLIGKLGSKWVYIKLLFVTLVIGSAMFILYHTSRTTAAIITLIFCNIFYLYVIINNLIAISKQDSDNEH